MIEVSIAATSVAHGIHYAVLGIGLVGVLVLLGPQLVGGRSAATVNDEHALRVRALTEQVSSGRLGLTMTPALGTAVQPHVVDHAGARYLPIAVMSSAAAAGVHAAVGPAHFRESLLLGLFFAGAALAQLGWSATMAFRPSRALLVAAVVGNSAVLVLWLVTRTLGLPGLLPGPEAIGPWDVACGLWELAVVLTAVRILRAGPEGDLRLPALSSWPPSARAWVLGSTLVIAALAFVSAGG